MADVKVTVKNGKLIIELPLNENPTASKSGKTLLVASSGGAYKSDVEVNGQKVIVGVNAYIYATPKA